MSYLPTQITAEERTQQSSGRESELAGTLTEATRQRGTLVQPKFFTRQLSAQHEGQKRSCDIAEAETQKHRGNVLHI